MFKIESITILLTEGTDRISFKTNLPTPYPEMQYPADLSMQARKGYGAQYCAENFPGVPIEIIDTTAHKTPMKFSR